MDSHESGALPSKLTYELKRALEAPTCERCRELISPRAPSYGSTTWSAGKRDRNKESYCGPCGALIRRHGGPLAERLETPTHPHSK